MSLRTIEIDPILAAVLRQNPPPVIHVLDPGDVLVCRDEGGAESTNWYYSARGVAFRLDEIGGGPVLLCTLDRPEGYAGWFGDRKLYCKGGPLDGQRVTVRYRLERADVSEALSR